jgi:hypothetical protein
LTKMMGLEWEERDGTSKGKTPFEKGRPKIK